MKVLVDTNVFVYLYDHADEAKAQRARSVLASGHEFMVSTQVLIEFSSVAARKLGLSRSEAVDMLGLLDYPTIPIDRALVERAAALAAKHDLSIFDALMVEAAATAGCQELWTEDLAAGSTINGVRIVNPFA